MTKIIADGYFGLDCKPDVMADSMIGVYLLAKQDIEGVILTISKQRVRRRKVIALVVDI